MSSVPHPSEAVPRRHDPARHIHDRLDHVTKGLLGQGSESGTAGALPDDGDRFRFHVPRGMGIGRPNFALCTGLLKARRTGPR